MVLLPAHRVRPYVRRNKSDRTDAAGLLEAARCDDIHPVPPKSPDRQGTQGLHRIREHHKAQRTAAINVVRGLLREFGVIIPTGAENLRPATLAAMEDGDIEMPMALRHALAGLLDQIAASASAMNVGPQFVDSTMARATRPTQSRKHECNRSVLPGSNSVSREGGSPPGE